MGWINDLKYRWRALRLRRRQERELTDELSFHLAMETDDLVRRGVPQREAERRARIALGGIPGIQEGCRDAWGTRLLLDGLRDLRGALRRLVQEPRFAALVIISLALGIGAVAVIFSMIDAVLLRPLPFGETQRIVAFQEITPGGDLFSISDANLLDLEEQAHTVEAIAGVVFPQPRPSLGQGEDRIQLSAFAVTPGFFEVLGVEARIGRTFHRDEGPPGSSPRTLVLSHGAWQKYFGSSPEIVGRDLDIDGERYAVLGILPSTFRYGVFRPDVYLPYVPDPDFPRGDRRINAFARLAPGVELTAARSEAETLAQRLAEEYPNSNAGWGVDLRPVGEFFLGAELRRNHFVLLGAVILLLLLTCVNVSSLLLARLSDRSREIQLRRVLGASRGRVLAQLLTESLVLGLCGALGGLLLAFLTVPIVRTLPVPVPRLDEMVVDLRVVAAVATISLVTGLLFGLTSAWRLTAARETEVLKGKTQGGDPRGTRLRSALVACEVALATVLAVGAGLLTQSFGTLEQVDSGFSHEGILLAPIDLPTERYGESTQATVTFYHRLVERVGAFPGVQSAGATVVSPFRGPSPSNWVGTETMLEKEEFTRAQWRSVTPHLFRTLGIPLLRGRDFVADGPPRNEVIISGRLADRLWPGEDPLGQQLRWGAPDGPLLEVIGVVGEVQDLYLGVEPPFTVYVPQQFMGWPAMVLAIRSDLPPEALTNGLGAAIRELDPLLAVPPLEPLASQRRDALAQPLLSLQLMALFSLLAVVLAAVGIYGMVSYAVGRRHRELGLRAALGAHPRQLLQLALQGSLRLVVVGLGAGLLGTLALAGTLRSVLYQTSPFEPQVWLMAAAVLLVVGLGASWLPARRAARLDPAVVLRED